jgi:hypothetical protein
MKMYATGCEGLTVSVGQYSETNVIQFSFSLLRIKGLCMFRALLIHPHEVLHKRHLVYCVRVMSVGCTILSSIFIGEWISTGLWIWNRHCSETSAVKHHTLENNPKDYTQHYVFLLSRFGIFIVMFCSLYFLCVSTVLLSPCVFPTAVNKLYHIRLRITCIKWNILTVLCHKLCDFGTVNFLKHPRRVFHLSQCICINLLAPEFGI